MYVITYYLKENNGGLNDYYDVVSDFTGEVLNEAINLFNDTVERYSEFSKENKKYTIDEAVLELLIMGVLWKVYSGDASKLDDMPGSVLVKLSELRKSSKVLKPGIDILKGFMSTLYLSPDLYDNLEVLSPSVINLEKLIKWLEATGEFNQEVKKLKGWAAFFQTLTSYETTKIIASCLVYAIWFEEKSEKCLGVYTQNVERYLNEIRPKRYWHEDVIFCGRRRIEYHLNMVGAEIMNKVFREKFLETKNKVLLLPVCIRMKDNSKCNAVGDHRMLKCKKCLKECTVCRLTQIGDDNGFEVIMVPHESSISAGGKKDGFFNKDTGVVGVACVLNLISGGWMLEDMGIPAQCVLLDYCGCKNHWHDEGIPTSINIAKLAQILCIDNNKVAL